MPPPYKSWLAACMAALMVFCAFFPAGAIAANSSPYDTPLPVFSMPVTPDELHLAYYKYSPAAIVKALQKDDAANWNMIIAKIMEGDKIWISYSAKYVYPGTDAGTTTEFTVALAHALGNNPEAVIYLEGFSPNISLLNICSLPFIEPEYAFIQSYGKKTLAALEQLDVGGQSLQDSKATCMRRLRDSLERADQIYREGRWNRQTERHAE